MPKILIEGSANIGINLIHCVCGVCGHNDNEDAIIEFNFQEQRVIYVCSKCKQENSITIGQNRPPPYPKIGVSS